MWVPKLLLTSKMRRIFSQKKRPFLPPKHAFLGTYIDLAGRLTWCPVGMLVGGCGVRAALSIEHIPTKISTGFSFIYKQTFIIGKLVLTCLITDVLVLSLVAFLL